MEETYMVIYEYTDEESNKSIIHESENPLPIPNEETKPKKVVKRGRKPKIPPKDDKQKSLTDFFQQYKQTSKGINKWSSG